MTESRVEKEIIPWQAKSTGEKLALRLLHDLTKKGFESYIVGGYVRDLLLKREETGAIDIATSARPEKVTRLLHSLGYRVIPTGIKHGTVTVHKGKDDIEITTFRTEGKYEDRRHPDRVKYIADPSADSFRRDFTVNAMYFDPLTRTILDFQKGFSDLEKKRLRFVGSASARIDEDALRLMRAARFATVLGFSLAPADIRIIRANARKITEISPERVKQELDKIISSSRRADGIKLLERLGLLRYILPEIDRLKRARHARNFHSEGNVFVHTLLAMSILEMSADLRTAYGLLFHDAGKAVTAKKTVKLGRSHISFYGHQAAGEKLARQAMQRLRFSNAEIDEISWYVKNHHVPFEIKNMRPAKKMVWALEPRFPNLLKIFRADSLASIPTDRKGRKQKPSLASYRAAQKILAQAQSHAEYRRPLVTGHDVMKALHIKPGPLVGKILRQVRDAQLAGNIASRNEAIQLLKNNKQSI